MDIEKYADEHLHFYHASIPKKLKEILTNHNIKTLLDCGCGDGALLHSMEEEGFLKNKKIFAIDLSEKRVSLTKTINSNFIVNVDSAEELNTINDHSIDLLISTQVIEHVDDKKMIENIHRVLKKGGLCYLTTVFKKWYGWYFYKNNGKRVLDPTHLREYAKEEQLLNFIEGNGFEIHHNSKKVISFPMIDFFIRRIPINNKRHLFDNHMLKIISNLKIPIPGYYNWELIFRKNGNIF